MLSDLLLILGVVVLAMALRSVRLVPAQKLAVLCVLATSYLIGWRLLGQHWLGALLALSWLFLPWLEILLRVRKLTLPVERNLRHKTPPSREDFPALGELTEELEAEGFAHVDDVGWEWHEQSQFFRLGYRAESRTQGAICYVEQDDLAFYYFAISSRGADGRVWTTWNYPFSASLKHAPQWRVQRIRGDRSVLELHLAHQDFLRANGVIVQDLHPVEPDSLHEEIQKDLRTQMNHNIAIGVLELADDGTVRYSWHGMFFLWLQFLRDFVRM